MGNSLISKPLKDMTSEERSAAFALYDRRVMEVQQENSNFKASQRAPMVISDDMGLHGIFNHADGKRYDSKSEFNKAVKAKGCRIVGNDWNDSKYKTPSERGVRGDYNVRPQLKEAIQKVLS